MDRRNRIISLLMGRHVSVTVDRPMGYCHNGLVYPVNYGHIPAIIAGDGEPQDVYILGVDTPVFSFTGRVIGVIRRKDDVEDKLVVAPDGMRFHQGQIAEAVAFQERFFDTSVDSIFRKSCGVIPYRKGETTEFLILLQRNGSWSFPKGHMEAWESETDTALRELQEETGLDTQILPDKQVVINYSLPPTGTKQVVLMPGEVWGKIRLQSSEIVSYRWCSMDTLGQYLHPDTYAVCKGLLEQL